MTSPWATNESFCHSLSRWASPITRLLLLWRCGIQSAAELRWLITWKCADRSDAFWAWSWAPNKALCVHFSYRSRQGKATHKLLISIVRAKLLRELENYDKNTSNKKELKIIPTTKNHFLVCFQIFRKELSVLARSEIAAIVRRAPTQKPAQVEKDWSIFQKQLLRAKREERKSFQFLLFISEESYQSWKSDFSLIFLSCVVCFWLLRESWLVSSDASCEK